MTQPDLFPTPEDRRCGACVHFNRGPMPTAGACSPRGPRTSHNVPCEMWFGLDQLHRALYDRKLV